MQPDAPPLSRIDDGLLARTLDGVRSPAGAISISKLQSDTDLTDYLDQAARMKTDVFLSRQAGLAFWINVHNAYVMDILRSNPGVRSIDDISGFRYAKVVIVDGKTLSLDDIEHSILTKQFREPRAFFALWDGTRSSPALAAEPYWSDSVSQQLDRQLRSFLADSTKNYLVKHSNTLYLSPIFRDYQDEIEAVTGSLSAFVEAYAPADIARWIHSHPNLTIAFLGYDASIFASDIQTAAPSHERLIRTPARRPSSGIY